MIIISYSSTNWSNWTIDLCLPVFTPRFNCGNCVNKRSTCEIRTGLLPRCLLFSEFYTAIYIVHTYLFSFTIEKIVTGNQQRQVSLCIEGKRVERIAGSDALLFAITGFLTLK